MRRFQLPTFIAIICFAVLAILFSPAYYQNKVFAIQIGAFKNGENAGRLVKKINSQGYDAYSKKEESAGDTGQPANLVLIGRYKTLLEARKGAHLLKQKNVITGAYLIKTLPADQDTAAGEDVVVLAQAATPKTTDTPASPQQTKPAAKELLLLDTPATSLKATSPPEATAYLQEGINQYKNENYEEAIEVLEKARKQDRTSSTAAFFLGLAYKQTTDYQQALANMRDAVSFTPPIKEAVIEMIDILNQLDQLDEAMKWVVVAERNDIFPAKTAFLKGMIMSKQGQYAQAVAAFEKSKGLEKSYAQSADFQIAIAYMQDRNYAKARERFQASITQDPLSDLASYARRYQDIVEEQSFLQRPLRVTLGVTGQYDTNMLQEPITFPGLPDSGNERSLALNTTARLDYVPILPGNWLFNASYAALSRVYEKNSTRYDLFANTFSAAPGYGLGRFALNLSGNYTFVLKRGDYDNNGGGYRRYSENFTVGPQMRFLAGTNHVLELYTGYAKKNYFKTTPVGNPQDNMSAGGFDSYLSWMWLFQNGGLFNARFAFTVDNADGIYWNCRNYKFTANLIYPVWKKINFQLGGEYNLVPYTAENLNFNSIIRLDQIYTGIIGFNWNINRYLTALVQYTGTRANSNVYIYDYSRSLWSAGVEVRF